ncbi:NUDIX domain-containing protein [Egicoccus sp. AB-alg6-2]|uniref:NUDIX domain-containing protein n=1 Tax=Egicoccus sp. AB-alg6-2 TaxID=3242692 RepID=UPI00359D6C25
MSVPAPARSFLDPDVVPADVHRRAARVVLLDGDRVLLEHVRVHGQPEQGSWWELPGGGLEGTETTAEAAAREVAEETGYDDVDVGPALATVRVRYRSATHVAEQHTVVHVAWLRSRRRCPRRMDELETAGLLDLAWCTLDEVADGRRLDLPEIRELARDALAGRFVPRRLTDRDVVCWSDDAPDGQPLDDGARATILDQRLVVRDAAPWSATVQAWLAHLREFGVDDVPAPLGIDANGREAVSFVDGEVSTALWPASLRSDEGMARLGRLLRLLWRASAGFVAPPDAVWRTGPRPRLEGEVIAHGDVGHGNLVWRPDGAPALIDWEFAHPAQPLHDLAGAAVWLVPLTDFDHERRGFDASPDRRARLHALAAGAGVTVDTLLEAIPPVLRWERRRVEELGALAIRPFDAYLDAGQPAGFSRVEAWLRRHAGDLR